MEQDILQQILVELKELKAGQQALENGQKALEAGQKSSPPSPFESHPFHEACSQEYPRFAKLGRFSPRNMCFSTSIEIAISFLNSGQ